MPRRCSSGRWRIWTLSLLLAVPAGAAAQESTGTITGRVTTPDGRPLAGATIVARAPELVDKRAVVSSDAGAFSFPSLPPGRYVISCELSGHVTVKRTLSLSAREIVFTDFQMHASPRPEEAITVVGEPFVRAEMPPASSAWWQSTLETLPVGGGLSSAIAISPEVTAAAALARISIDGVPLGAPGATSAPAWPNLRSLQQMSAEHAVPSADAAIGSPMVLAVTRSGGDRLSGSARATFGDVNAAADDPLIAQDTADTATAIEGVLGGPLRVNRVWLVASGRHSGETVSQFARLTTTAIDERRRDNQIESKLTAALSSRHRITGSWLAGERTLTNTAPDGAATLEAASAAIARADRFGVLSIGYTGAITSRWTLDGRVTRERSSIELDRGTGIGGPFPVLDLQTRGAIGGGPDCASCDDARTDRMTARVTSSALFATSSQLHRVIAGFESGSGRWDAAGQPDGGSFSVVASRFRAVGSGVVPVLDGNGSAWIVWRQPGGARVETRRRSFFVADEWRVAPGITLFPGVRWTRDTVSEDDGPTLVETTGLSPSAQIVWQPRSTGWRINAGAARIASDPLTALAASGAIAAPVRAFLYSGPPINVSSTSAIDADTAAAAALAWFQTNGSVGRPPFLAAGPGLTLARTDADQPHWWEWTAGVDRVFGDIRLRADYTSRHGSDGLTRRLTTQRVDENGSALALGELVNDDARAWSQRVLAIEGDYRIGIQANLAVRYAWSRDDGFPFDAVVDPLAAAALAYPSFAGESWAVPGGSRNGEGRHHLRVLGHVDALVNESLGTLSVDALHTIESGPRFGVTGWTAVPAAAGDEAFAQRPVIAPYAFSAADAFAGERLSRTDIGVTLRRPLPGSPRGRILIQFHVLNLLNTRATLSPSLYYAARTSASDAGLAAFDPRRDTPIAGVDWDLDPRLQDRLASPVLTLPRAYRLLLTVRF